MTSGSWYIGCSCDHKFVQHTAVMLTSLAENGNAPEATVLVAAFGLRHEDYSILLSHAGRMASRVRIIDVNAALLGDLAGKTWEAHYPPAVLGRLFLPTVIQESGARLLTLDSDMIVNRSVRPLFESPLEGYLGAIHDTPRHDDPSYFNSGMMVINVDRFRADDIAGRCLEWLANSASPPRWPDQDALNTIIGNDWHRLERSWNWAYWGGDGQLTTGDYERANIAHFTGQGKPWSHEDHPGRGLYTKYLREFEVRRQKYKMERLHVDDNFVITAVEFFLGRDGERGDIARFRAASSFATVAAIVQSDEFMHSVAEPLLHDRSLPAGRFTSPPSYRHRAWAAQRLPMSYHLTADVMEAKSWLGLLRDVCSDHAFRARTGLDADPHKVLGGSANG
jgi:lipopolysaccharide biosynthesis glycosyltransferase